MNKYFKVMFCLVLCLGIISIVSLPMASCEEGMQAMEESISGNVTAVDEEMPAMEESIPESVIAGEVSSVDLDNSTITLKVVEDEATQVYAEKTVIVNDATMISKAEATAGIADLVVGDNATVAYTEDSDGEMVATFVTVSQ
ncbi:MAG: hypothetical protein PHY46_00465 [Candidatus Omnitrophica bacterium]|nr:hypothetical protein [Candidatus Omnitrophota bacterium]MDD5356102.1 hypothetical protein [Candidatus Omnitrophota bacterium]